MDRFEIFVFALHFRIVATPESRSQLQIRANGVLREIIGILQRRIRELHYSELRECVIRVYAGDPMIPVFYGFIEENVWPWERLNPPSFSR